MNTLRGIALMILAMAGFAVSDGFIKALTGSVPTGQLLIVFGVSGATILATVTVAQGVSLYGSWLVRPIFLARMAADMLAASAIVTAFATTSLSLVSAIIQVSPLMAALTAVWLLGERLGPRRLIAICVGLVGVLIILEPWGERIEAGAIFAAIGASMLALRDVLTRKMPADIPSGALVSYGFLAIAPGGLLIFAVDPQWVAFDAATTWLVAGGVLTGIFGYTMITLASRIAEISAIAPFRYSRLVFALLIGSLVFGESLSPAAMVGSALVIGSGIFVFVREARLKATGHAPETDDR